MSTARPRAPHRRFRWVLGLLLLLAACGGDDTTSSGASDGAEIRPFSEVQDSEFAFELDPADPTRGIFRVTTSEPMICAIVWGEDDTFGRFNNSQSMNGTGIIEHDVALPDVEPGTEYRFLVQGTTADGTLYRSEISSFAIEGGDAAAGVELPAGENVATGAVVVDASSSFSDSFVPELALDGDLGTEWSTRGDGDGAFLVVDVGAPVDLGAVEFVTRSMSDGSAVTETFTVSADGGEPLGPFPAGTPATRRPSDITLRGQVFRFEVVSSTGGNVGAVEVGLYRDAG